LEKSQTAPRLQLVGVIDLLSAAKYEEIYPVKIHDLLYICADTYSKADILKIKAIMVKTLNYQITAPTAHTFLQSHFLKTAYADKRTV